MPKRLTLDNAKEIARQRRGVCLLDKYTNGYSPMQWKCTKDHLWTAIFDSIKYQRLWCPYCARQAKNTLDIAKMLQSIRAEIAFQMNILMVHLI
jgi:hypothetical protein